MFFRVYDFSGEILFHAVVEYDGNPADLITWEITGGNITVTDEADHSEYFSINALPDTVLEKQRQRIHDWVSSNSQPCMKVQNTTRNIQQPDRDDQTLPLT